VVWESGPDGGNVVLKDFQPGSGPAVDVFLSDRNVSSSEKSDGTEHLREFTSERQEDSAEQLIIKASPQDYTIPAAKFEFLRSQTLIPETLYLITWCTEYHKLFGSVKLDKALLMTKLGVGAKWQGIGGKAVSGTFAKKVGKDGTNGFLELHDFKYGNGAPALYLYLSNETQVNKFKQGQKEPEDTVALKAFTEEKK
jgi:hypothetical protein